MKRRLMTRANARSSDGFFPSFSLVSSFCHSLSKQIMIGTSHCNNVIGTSHCNNVIGSSHCNNVHQYFKYPTSSVTVDLILLYEYKEVTIPANHIETLLREMPHIMK